MPYMRGERRTDSTGPAVHVFTDPPAAYWATLLDRRGDVRDGDVLLVPSYGLAAVVIEAHAFVVSLVSGGEVMEHPFLRLSPRNARRLSDGVYADTFDVLWREMQRPEFGCPEDINAVDWYRTAVRFVDLCAGDYVLYDGLWAVVGSHAVESCEDERTTRAETVLRNAVVTERRLVTWHDWDDDDEPNGVVAAWRPLPLTAIEGP